MTKPTGKPRGRPKTKEYVTLMARVPQDMADQVQRYAGLHQQPISVVLRDAMQLIVEEERYQPFLSDRNAESRIVSDIKAVAKLLSDIEAVASLLPGGHAEGRIVSDIKAVAKLLSDIETAVKNVSDIKEEDDIL